MWPIPIRKVAKLSFGSQKMHNECSGTYAKRIFDFFVQKNCHLSIWDLKFYDKKWVLFRFSSNYDQRTFQKILRKSRNKFVKKICRQHFVRQLFFFLRIIWALVNDMEVPLPSKSSMFLTQKFGYMYSETNEKSFFQFLVFEIWSFEILRIVWKKYHPKWCAL